MRHSGVIQSGAMFGTLGTRLHLGFDTYVTWRKALNIFSPLFSYLYKKKNNVIYNIKLEFRWNKWVCAALELGQHIVKTIYILVVVICFQSSKSFEPSLAWWEGGSSLSFFVVWLPRSNRVKFLYALWLHVKRDQKPVLSGYHESTGIPETVLIHRSPFKWRILAIQASSENSHKNESVWPEA